MVSIAHRLSTAESADLVLVFADGRIVEPGTHAELVAAGGTYASLYESWLGNTRDAAGTAPSPAATATRPQRHRRRHRSVRGRAHRPISAR